MGQQGSLSFDLLVEPNNRWKKVNLLSRDLKAFFKDRPYISVVKIESLGAQNKDGLLVASYRIFKQPDFTIFDLDQRLGEFFNLYRFNVKPVADDLGALIFRVSPYE